jgi:transposase
MPNFTLPLDIESLEIISQTIDAEDNIVFEVKSKKKDTRCRKCGQSANIRHGYGETIKVRHLPILDTPVYLQIKVVRYECQYCDDRTTTSEQYDWRERKSKTTKGLDNYINRNMIHSTLADVSKKEKISYDIVESALMRGADMSVDWSVYTDLTTIGIDEIALRKGHNNYITIVSTKDKLDDLSVLAVLADRSKATVQEFLESIPCHLKKTVKSVCTDMYDGFVNAAAEVFGSRVVVVDRYHVAKLYREPLDELRIEEMQRLKPVLSAADYGKLEGMMWIVRKKHECLSIEDKDKLQLLYKHSPLLKAAHKKALKLTCIFNKHHNRKQALTKLSNWIKDVKNSDVSCFNKFIRTLDKYKANILNYFKSRKNSGFVEGLNNKIKVIKRRCYGIAKTESLFQRLFLDLRGYKAFA